MNPLSLRGISAELLDRISSATAVPASGKHCSSFSSCSTFFAHDASGLLRPCAAGVLASSNLCRYASPDELRRCF